MEVESEMGEKSRRDMTREQKRHGEPPLPKEEKEARQWADSYFLVMI